MITIPLITVIGSFVENYYEQVLDGKFKQLALDISSVYNSDMDAFEKKAAVNYLMATCVDDMQVNDFTTHAAIAFYDMKAGEILVRSAECNVLENSDLYMNNSLNDIKQGGLKSISLDAQLREFYYKHKDHDVYVKKLYVLNDVIFPTQLIVLDDKYKEIDSASIDCPVIITETVYDEPPVLEIRGNKDDDITLNLLSNFTFDRIGENDDNTSILKVSYPSITAKTNLKLTSLDFDVDDVSYHVDCAYRINFWGGALTWMLIGELIFVLICAALAFWSTKETLDCKH